MGKKVVCPACGWAGIMLSFPDHCAKTITHSFMKFGTYGPYGLVVPFGGHPNKHQTLKKRFLNGRKTLHTNQKCF